MCVGRCDCLVASGRVAVTVANHSISVFFLTTIAHHIEIQMYIALGNIPLEPNLTLCVSGMLRHLLFAYD